MFLSKFRSARFVCTLTLRQTLIGVAALQLLLVLYDIASGYEPFLLGDRSEARLNTINQLISGKSSDFFDALFAGAVHPGEYVLQLPFYMVAGSLGVILFQVGLSLLAVAAMWKLAEQTIESPCARPIVAWLYALTPMTLTFTHQLTTEAVATPFCVFFLFFTISAVSSRRLAGIIAAGACLGMVIFIRPGYAIILPALLAASAFLSCLRRSRDFKILAAICAIALLPLAGWITLYTVETGRFGYTGGNANMQWNLRSRVFFIERANGRTGPDEVAGFTDYKQLWSYPGSTGGIPMRRYLAIASEHPADYIKAGLIDEAMAFCRGGLSKFAVDYLGIARGKGIKDWRTMYDSEGLPALIRWTAENADVLAVAVLELVSSLIAAGICLLIAILAIVILLRSRGAGRPFTRPGLTLAVLTTCLIATTAVSAQVVDRAQGRLRNPADPALLLLAAMMIDYTVRNRRNANKGGARDH